MISKDLRLLGDSDWQVGRRWYVPLHTPVIFSVHRVPDLAYSLVFTRVCVTWAFHVTFNQHISSIFLQKIRIIFQSEEYKRIINIKVNLSELIYDVIE